MDVASAFSTALALHQQGQFQEAIEHYQALLQNDEHHADAWHCLGMAYAQTNQYEQAKVAIEKAIQLQPDAPHYHNNLGNTLKALGDLSAAIIQYQSALTLQPHYAEAHNNLGTVYYLQEKWNDAIREFSAAIHNKNHYVEAHRNLGMTLLQLAKHEEAKRQFQNVIALHPEDWQSHFQLGTFSLHEKDLSKAIEHYHAVLAIFPSHIEALNNLGAAYIQLKQTQKALDYFTEVLLIDEHNVEAKHNCAALYMQHHHYENALRHYEDLVSARPNDIEVRYNMGVALMSMGKLQEAIPHYLAVLRLSPDHVDAITNLGAVYMRLDERKTALNYLDRAQKIKFNPAVQHMIDALSETQTTSVPKAYTQNLFDQYALHYNHHLQETLQYSLPKKLRDLYNQHGSTEQKRILDLGCGTGLCGAAFADLRSRLIGIDLSDSMCDIARKLGIYDEVLCDDILTIAPKISQDFDLIIAGEVFEYFGDLAAILHVCQQHLSTSGYLLFSTEITDQGPFHLQKTGRFAHQPAYVAEMLNQHGFKLIDQQRVVARLQEAQPLTVAMVLAQRSL